MDICKPASGTHQTQDVLAPGARASSLQNYEKQTSVVSATPSVVFLSEQPQLRKTVTNVKGKEAQVSFKRRPLCSQPGPPCRSGGLPEPGFLSFLQASLARHNKDQMQVGI